MPITAAEVRATQFRTTRLRAGYDMDEVDAFLDIVEADVAQYADELQRSRDDEAVLRAQCDQLQARLTVSERRLDEAVPGPAPEQPVEPEVSADLRRHLGEHPEAADVLAAAQRSADEIVRFAEARAEEIRSSVRSMLEKQSAALDEIPD